VNLAGVTIDDIRAVSGGDICQAWQGFLDGRPVFAKTLRDAPPSFFAAEARGLALLRIDGAPPVPDVIAVADDGLVLDWVEPGPPTRAAAEDFGRRLAVLHQASRPTFGASHDGYIGSLALPNTALQSWPQFYVERRVMPYLAALSTDERVPVERLCARIDELAGPAEPPATIHGDLWSGNLLWGSDGVVRLVDAASAHGGHRETDLAMLALFGAPHFDAIMAAYQEVAPLAGGWRQRVSLHQLHPLLVHATLFGGGYGARAGTAARLALSAA
jgi:fructosamine-3-kinase